MPTKQDIRPIHVHLYSCPTHASSGPSIELLGIALPTLVCPGISQTQFEMSFEEAAERLQSLERLSFEMDGSFVWAGSIGDDSWQLYGMLYDYGDRLQRIELQGACPLEKWRQLQTIFDRETRPQVAQLLPEHCLVSTHALDRIWELNCGGNHDSNTAES